MIGLLRGEAIKLRTTRTALGFAAAAILLTLAFTLLGILVGDGPRTVEDKRSTIAFGGVSFLLVIFGIVGATGEYRHRTLAPALLVCPDRGKLVLARMLAYGAAGLVVSLVVGALTFAIALVLLPGTDGPGLAASDYVDLGVGGLLSGGLAAMVGVGIGVIVANQVGAVVGFLVYLFVVESLIPLLSDDVTPYLIGQTLGAVGGDSGDDVLSIGSALAVLAAWSVVLVVAGVLIDRGRDVT